jgi:indole-3-glycerol phosphate synthase
VSATYLDTIVAWHRRRAAADEREWSTRQVHRSQVPSLGEALLAHRSFGNAVIAEVKRRSPSKGDLAASLVPGDLAQRYVAGGASAISVLTDAPHFGGSVEDLREVVAAVSVPVLRKDFTVSINDVLDTVEMGASCVLLIAAALERAELAELLQVARDHGLDALVEVHDATEAAHAVELGASLIGVNQRDLHSFEVDARRAEIVAASLPSNVVRVAESGFHTSEAVARAAAAGFDAVLVGEAFVTAADVENRVRDFVGHPIGGVR